MDMMLYDEYLEEYCKNAEDQEVDEEKMAQIRALVADREHLTDWCSGEELASKAKTAFRARKRSFDERVSEGDS